MNVNAFETLGLVIDVIAQPNTPPDVALVQAGGCCGACCAGRTPKNPPPPPPPVDTPRASWSLPDTTGVG